MARIAMSSTRTIPLVSQSEVALETPCTDQMMVIPHPILFRQSVVRPLMNLLFQELDEAGAQQKMETDNLLVVVSRVQGMAARDTLQIPFYMYQV